LRHEPPPLRVDGLFKGAAVATPWWSRGRARGAPAAARQLKREVKTMPGNVNPSGLTDDECQEFHKYYIQGYLLWAVGAFFAHSLVWIWRPWF
jgi:light-harvesting complex 1 beta chain